MYHPICVATGDTINPVIKANYPSAVILNEDETKCIFVDSHDFRKHEIMMAKAELLDAIKIEQQLTLKHTL